MRRARLTGILVSTLMATAVAGPSASSAPAALQPVDLELVLATDNSQSVDRTEARLQREGVAADMYYRH